MIASAQRAAATGMAEAAVAMVAASLRRERRWPPPSVACPVVKHRYRLQILFQYMCNETAAREAVPISLRAQTHPVPNI